MKVLISGIFALVLCSVLFVVLYNARDFFILTAVTQICLTPPVRLLALSIVSYF